MSEKTFFLHSSTARKDPRAARMIKLLGFAAYGVYWEIVSLIYKSGGKCETNHIIYHSDICKDLRISTDHAKCVLNDFDLFESDGKYHWFKENESMHRTA